jgi:hypothetical protein
MDGATMQKGLESAVKIASAWVSQMRSLLGAVDYNKDFIYIFAPPLPAINNKYYNSKTND